MALAVAGLSLLTGLVIAITGGFRVTVGGIQLSAHGVAPAALLGAAGIVTALAAGGAAASTRELQASWRRAGAAAPWIGALAALATCAVGIAAGTFAAAGADAYGYLSQAANWAGGRLVLRDELITSAPWPNADWTLSPFGYRPGPAPGVLVPTYAPGFPLALAAVHRLAGPDAVHYLVPILGAAAVWLTYLAGRRVGGPACGIGAAILLATSPVFLYQLVQPMNDVPATMWCVAAVLAAATLTNRGSLLAGLSASAALITRATTAPLAVVAIALLWRAADTTDRSTNRRRLAWFAAGVLPGAVALAAINTVWYGAPWRSGYGTVPSIFSVSNVSTNLPRYAAWLFETHSPFVLLAAVAPLVQRRASTAESAAASARLLNAGLALFAATAAIHLTYERFEHWSYLRFLLPGLPFLLIASVTVALRAVDRLPLAGRTAAFAIGLTLLASWQVRVAHDRAAFGLESLEQRYVQVGYDADRLLPARAIVLTVQHSGSLRWYAGRSTLRWDMLPPEWLDRALAFLEARGSIPYFLLEDWEEPAFRTRFAPHSKVGELAWPPMAEIRASVKTRIYDPRDRARFLAGVAVPTRRPPPR